MNDIGGFMILRLAQVAVCLVLSASYCAADLVVFGDSLSDNGNTSSLTAGLIPAASSGYIGGTFTNGANWTATLANRLGVAAPVASTAGGDNYAHGGARVTSDQFLRPSLTSQISSYISSITNGSSISASDLHVIWGGANDLLSNATDSQAQAVAGAIQAGIDSLYQSGARRFLVMNLPVLSSTPLVQLDPNLDGVALDQVVGLFNSALSSELSNTAISLPGIEIVEFDTASLFSEVIANPAGFGFTNVTDSAAPIDLVSFIPGLATGLPPPNVNSNEYLFYDGLHPTSTAHAIVGNRAADLVLAVPEPNCIHLALLGCVLTRRFRSHRGRRKTIAC